MKKGGNGNQKKEKHIDKFPNILYIRVEVINV